MDVLTFFNKDLSIIETQLTGDISFHDVLEFVDAMIELTISTKCYRWLIDYTDARYKLSTYEIYILPNTVFEKLDKIGEYKYVLKRAIVSVNDRDDFGLLFAVAKIKEQRLKIVSTRFNAISWLQEE